mgnify:CR=1 FL=1
MESKYDSENEYENKKIIEDNSVSYEDKTVWFIWIALILVSVAILPFVARSPTLSGFIADLCLAIVP